MIPSICTTCGAPYDRGSSNSAECSACRPDPDRAGTARAELAEAYDWQWRKLSIRARRIQTFCSDCNTTEDLTVDHTPSAWARYERGLPIRLRDVDVLCRSCNSARGAARGDNPTWTPRRPDLPDLDALDADLEKGGEVGHPRSDPHPSVKAKSE